MRDDPAISQHLIEQALHLHYGITVTAIEFLPLGHDLSASVFKVIVTNGTERFLKIRKGPVELGALQVPRTLAERGVPNIMTPVPTTSFNLSCPLDNGSEWTIVLYPFIQGKSAKERGMTEAQWREFGATLRAVHDSGVANLFRDVLRVEDFRLPAGALVRRVSLAMNDGVIESAAARCFATFWGDNRARIDRVLARAEELGRSLRARTFEEVPCHADIHAANILLGDDGRIWLVDWDGPVIAPRERDLLFVIGSRIAREVAPQEEHWFFLGYGDVVIDREALVYYRYERIIEDLGEFGWSVMFAPDRSEEMRAYETRLAMSLFEPGGDIDRAETVPRHQ